MNKSTSQRAAIPGHVIALSALAALAALLAYALYDRLESGQSLRPEQPRPGEISRIDLEAWANAAQQKVLGTARLTAGASAEASSRPQALDYTVAGPVRKTVTHLGVSPRRADTPRFNARDASPAYASPSLAGLPPPGD